MTFKNLAKKAKSRLIASNEIGKTETKALSAGGSYVILSEKLSIESDPLFSRVKKLVESEPDSPGAIGKLIDKTRFSMMNNVEKDKYLLDLTKRYNRIKNHLENC